MEALEDFYRTTLEYLLVYLIRFLGKFRRTKIYQPTIISRFHLRLCTYLLSSLNSLVMSLWFANLFFFATRHNYFIKSCVFLHYFEVKVIMRFVIHSIQVFFILLIMCFSIQFFYKIVCNSHIYLLYIRKILSKE